MNDFLRKAASFPLWLMLVCLPAACALGLAPRPAPAAPAKAPTIVDMREQLMLPSSIDGTIRLQSAWRFHEGDNPAWADPDFDDSGWEKVDLTKSLADQGMDDYSGYSWFRLRVNPQPGTLPLSLFLDCHGLGQLTAYIEGAEAARTRGMPRDLAGSPQGYASPAVKATIARTEPDGSVLIAVRTWVGADPEENAGGRPVLKPVSVGSPEGIDDKLMNSISRAWDENVVAGVLVSFLFLAVAGLGATLFLAQRHHPEYLWLAVLCASVVNLSSWEIAFALALIPHSVFAYASLWNGWLFMAATLEFVLRFTSREFSRTAMIVRAVRVTQIGLQVLPLVSLMHFDAAYGVLKNIGQICFGTLVVLLLARSWRRGHREAGIMLLPFFLAVTVDVSDHVLDFAVAQKWASAALANHRHHLGPVAYGSGTLAFLVFLGSLISIIIYRFVRVSEEEQRTTAELEAARSVQALLIPTELPSNQNFMLEGAYLPANGVGGDFFQVLPLRDESMLIVVGDVSGKGLRAAMNASTLVGALRNELSQDPATVLNHLNAVMLGAVGPNAAFATCLCARIFPDGRMVVANAGHLNPYQDGRELGLAPDLPLGILAGIAYEQTTFQLKAGDRLVFLSDGVVEATNPQGELFGFERTQQVSNESARYIAQIAQRFGQTDDITVVSLYFAANAAKRKEAAAVSAN